MARLVGRGVNACKENAGAALLDACKEVKGSEPVQIGSYRGFTMSVEFSAWKQEYTLLLKGQMTHRASLGTDPRGNLTRIDNALSQMSQRLEATKAQLDNLYQQQAAAKEEVGKPFPYEDDLRVKSARLVELDTLLNLDGRGRSQPESVIAKSARPSVLDSFFSHILNSFKHRAEELGYDISFISDHMGGQEISYVDHARYRNCDGVVIASVDYTEHAVVDLANSGIPVVTIDCVLENCGSVLSDNVGGMTELVKYAYSMGHRKIAFAYGEDTPVTRRRISGFCRACKELGLSLPDEYLVQSMYLDPESSAAATRKLMELPDPPTCILYPDDIAHLGGKNELEKMGLSVPDDVSIVGYDGIDFSQMLRPKLTTMRQDAERMGELAAEELARAVEEGRSYIPGRHVVGGTLLPGETVKKLTP